MQSCNSSSGGAGRGGGGGGDGGKGGGGEGGNELTSDNCRLVLLLYPLILLL
tara:strand:+ start:346 stop:501 length:156 start_codon:yes stop_codon:yes gene_type:complete